MIRTFCSSVFAIAVARRCCLLLIALAVMIQIPAPVMPQAFTKRETISSPPLPSSM